MGMKARKRGVVMWASRDVEGGGHTLWTYQPERWKTLFVYASSEGSSMDFFVEGDWPGPQLEPGECKRVRVIIEEVED